MRNELLEKSAFMTDSPSETIVPVPTVVSSARVLPDLGAEVRPGLLDLRQVVADAAGSTTTAELSPNRSMKNAELLSAMIA